MPGYRKYCLRENGPIEKCYHSLMGQRKTMNTSEFIRPELNGQKGYSLVKIHGNYTEIRKNTEPFTNRPRNQFKFMRALKHQKIKFLIYLVNSTSFVIWPNKSRIALAFIVFCFCLYALRSTLNSQYKNANLKSTKRIVI